jgi:nitrite reductase (NADH) large subunit
LSTQLYTFDEMEQADSHRISVHFANYTEMRAVAPIWFWRLARWTTLGITLGLMALMWSRPAFGLPLFWGLVVPLVPLLLVVAPGLWRQVCPMAFLNQAPRSLGFSLGKTLPLRWQKASFGIAVGVFLVAVGLRAPWLNQSATGLCAVLSAMLLMAFAGGVVFKGRSGWCGTFCPLGPIQRAYGHAPLAVVRNGYCPTCVGCQQHCYDFSPRTAIFKDLDKADPRHAQMRQWFFGMLPGLILAFFTLGPAPTIGWQRYELVMAEAALSSLGLYALLGVVLPLNRYRLSLVFGVVALSAFYWFTGPGIVARLGELLHVAMPPALKLAAQGLGLLAGGVLAFSGLRNELMHRTAERRRQAAEARRQAEWARITIHPITVSNRATGKQSPVEPGQRLLDTLRQQGTLLPAGCGAGLCGGDAVAICEGIDKLAPPGEQELATLRRMGLEGRARLACMCEVTAPVTVDTRREALQSAPSAASGSGTPQVDALAEQGILRVVIIGNGVAGVTAAEALRRHSPSVDLTVISDEAQPFYNRMALADMLPDPSRHATLHLRGADWADDWRVRLQLNAQVVAIDREQRQVQLADGAAVPYDRLILATGADAARPGPAFAVADNGFVLRTLGDVQDIHGFVSRHQARSAVVQGGGVLGVEAALALRQWGLEVTVIERAPRLMAAQLDEAGAKLLTEALLKQGIDVVASVQDAQWLHEDGHLTGICLDDTDTLQADLFVACLGIRPRMALAEAAGLAITPRGIQVDAQQRSSDPSILAVGDVALPTGPMGLWPVAAEQADRAVAGLLGQAPSANAMSPVLLKLKTKLLDVCAWGETQAQDDDEVWVAPQCTEDTSWRIIWRGGTIVGWSCVGQPGSSRTMEKAVQAESMDAVREALDGM